MPLIPVTLVEAAGPLKACRVTATAFSIASGGFSAITFDTELEDLDGMITVPSDTITIRTAGWYVISAAAQVASPGANQLTFGNLTLNGNGIAPIGPISSGAPGYDPRFSAPYSGRLAVNDLLKWTVYQESGSPKNVNASLNIARVGS